MVCSYSDTYLPSLLYNCPPKSLTSSALGEYDPRPLDIWSCAIVCLALFFRGMPWNAAEVCDPNYGEFARGWESFIERNPIGLITDNDYPSCGKLFDALPKPSLRLLLLCMLHPDPFMRMTVGEALASGCVTAIECCCPDDGNRPESTDQIDALNLKSCELVGKALRVSHDHCPPMKKGKEDRQH